MRNKSNFREIRRRHYEHEYHMYPYLAQWKKNPYTFYKAKLYLELSTILTFLLFKTKIKPNTVTVTYIVLGIVGGVCLAVPLKYIIFLGILIFYFLSVLDWTDGTLARERNQTSITGDILDPYGALVGMTCFWSGVGLYLAHKSIQGVAYISPDITNFTSFIFSHFVYLLPIIPALFAMNLTRFAKYRLYTNHVVKELRKHMEKERNQEEPLLTSATNTKSSSQHSTAKKIMQAVNNIFSHRARFVDFILLLILLELLYPMLFLSWIVFLLFLLWQIILFFGILYTFTRSNYGEEDIQKMLREIDET